MQSVTTREIVVARYKENIDWLTKLSPCWNITVYNKGPADISSSTLLHPNIRVIPIENKGREAETIAYHLLHRYETSADFTIFIQASPFDHAPELLECIKVLEERTTFSETEKYIPITTRYNAGFPLPHIINNRQNRFFRVEDFSVYTLDFVEHIDTIGTQWISTQWHTQYEKPTGTNIMKYFFDSLEWNDALRPNQHTIKFSYAACFGVTKAAIQHHDKPFYKRLYYKTFDQQVAAWIAERAWLHIFNKDFNPDVVLPEWKHIPTQTPTICTHELVVARYNENIDWLMKVSPTWKITVYNKGPNDISSSITNCANVSIITLENKGREAGTYAYHMKERYESFAPLTVFTQGDPFDHSPELLECLSILETRTTTEKYIPLTIRYSNTIPPPHLCERRQNRFFRVEELSPYTLDTFEFIDAPLHGATHNWLVENKRKVGTNIVRDVSNTIGCNNKIEKTVQFHYAAIFAIQKNTLLQSSKHFYETIYRFSSSSVFAPYLLERMWLHIFDPHFNAETVLPEWKRSGCNESTIETHSDIIQHQQANTPQTEKFELYDKLHNAHMKMIQTVNAKVDLLTGAQQIASKQKKKK